MPSVLELRLAWAMKRAAPETVWSIEPRSDSDVKERAQTKSDQLEPVEKHFTPLFVLAWKRT